jgi:hypothetical protein
MDDLVTRIYAIIGEPPAPEYHLVAAAVFHVPPPVAKLVVPTSAALSSLILPGPEDEKVQHTRKSLGLENLMVIGVNQRHLLGFSTNPVGPKRPRRLVTKVPVTAIRFDGIHGKTLAVRLQDVPTEFRGNPRDVDRMGWALQAVGIVPSVG